jgi:hypothetical protein
MGTWATNSPHSLINDYKDPSSDGQDCHDMKFKVLGINRSDLMVTPPPAVVMYYFLT